MQISRPERNPIFKINFALTVQPPPHEKKPHTPKIKASIIDNYAHFSNVVYLVKGLVEFVVNIISQHKYLKAVSETILVILFYNSFFRLLICCPKCNEIRIC